MILEAVGIGLIQDQEQMQQYLMSTLLYTQAKCKGDDELQRSSLVLKGEEGSIAQDMEYSFRKEKSKSEHEETKSKERA